MAKLQLSSGLRTTPGICYVRSLVCGGIWFFLFVVGGILYIWIMGKMQKVTITIPSSVVLEDVNAVGEDIWNTWNEDAKMLFNYLIELCERNEAIIFGSDMFKMEGVQNKINLHKIMGAAKWNIAWEAAEFVSKPNDIDLG